MPKIDGFTYPDTIMGILEDYMISNAFRDFAKGKKVSNQIDFLTGSFTEQTEDFYSTYFAPDAKKKLGFASDLLEAAQKLHDRDDWSSKKWDKIIKVSNKAILDKLPKALVSDFYDSEYFAKAHEHKVGQKKVIDDNRHKNSTIPISYNAALKKMAAALEADNKAEVDLIVKGIRKSMLKNKEIDGSVTTKGILTRAQKSISDRKFGAPKTPDAAEPAGATKLDAKLAKVTDWESFGKLYKIDGVDDKFLKDAAILVAKTGPDSKLAISAAKRFLSKIKSSGFKNPKHAAYAIDDAMRMRAGGKTASRAFKASNLPKE